MAGRPRKYDEKTRRWIADLVRNHGPTEAVRLAAKKGIKIVPSGALAYFREFYPGESADAGARIDRASTSSTASTASNQDTARLLELTEDLYQKAVGAADWHAIGVKLKRVQELLGAGKIDLAQDILHDLFALAEKPTPDLRAAQAILRDRAKLVGETDGDAMPPAPMPDHEMIAAAGGDTINVLSLALKRAAELANSANPRERLAALDRVLQISERMERLRMQKKEQIHYRIVELHLPAKEPP